MSTLYNFYRQLVVSFCSLTLVFGQIASFGFTPFRLLAQRADILTTMSFTYLMHSAAYASERNYTQEGMELGKQGVSSARRPGVNTDNFTVDVTTRDGLTVQVPLGNKPDGTNYTESDLDSYRSHYNSPESGKAAAQNVNTPEANFLRSNINKQSHSSRRSDPAIDSAQRIFQTLGDDGMENLYGQCGAVTRPTPATLINNGGPEAMCYEVESRGRPIPCEINRKTRLVPKNGPTVVMVYIKDTPFNAAVGGPNNPSQIALMRALAAELRTKLEDAPNTRVAFFIPAEDFYTTYDPQNGEFGWYVQSPYRRPGDQQPSSVKSVKGFESSLADENVKSQIQGIGGQTTRERDHQEDMNNIDRILRNRPEPNKLLLVLDGLDSTNKQPTTSPSCSAKEKVTRIRRACSFNRTCYRYVRTPPPPEAKERCPATTTYNDQPNAYTTSYATVVRDSRNAAHTPGSNSFVTGGSRNYYSRPEDVSDMSYGLLIASGQFAVEDIWTEPSSQACYRAFERNEASGSLQCAAGPTGGCSNIDGIYACRGDRWSTTLTARVYDDEPLCVSVATNFSRITWRDAGNDYFLEQDGTTNAPLCNAFIADPTYAKVESSCIPETKDEISGRCLVYRDRFRGGYTPIQPDTTAPGCATTQAPACLDGSCIPEENETNDDFLKIATVLQMVESAAQDIKDCESGDCRFFKGTDYYCHDVNGYIPTQCCTQGSTAPTDFVSWFIAGREIWGGFQRAGGLELLKSGGIDLVGSWQSVKTGAYDVWSYVSKPVVSALDSAGWSAAGNVTGSGGAAAAEGAGTSFGTDQLKQYALDQTSRFLEKYYPDMASKLFESTASSGGQAVLSEAAGQYVQLIGNFASFLMAAYMYYQLALMAYEIYRDCDGNVKGKSMVELRTKRDKMRVCILAAREDRDDFLGNNIDRNSTYCCFASPLARIIQNEARKPGNLNIPFGNYNSPNCRGLTLQEMTQVKWDKVDFSEWTSILIETGVIPEDDTEMAAMANLERATKNKDNPDVYLPPSVTERNAKLIGGTDWDAVQEYNQERAWDDAEGADGTPTSPQPGGS